MASKFSKKYSAAPLKFPVSSLAPSESKHLDRLRNVANPGVENSCINADVTVCSIDELIQCQLVVLEED